MSSELIFERSKPGRSAQAQYPREAAPLHGLPGTLLRKTPPLMPQASEMQVVRHYTNLSQKNFSIDTHFYPLGSCTMKYNPRGAHRAASLPGFLQRHPLAPPSRSQGVLSCLYHLQEIIADVTGMAGVSLAPMAGAQGEFAGIAMIRAYHLSRGDTERNEVIVPVTAHGTNPATATMCGFKVREIAVRKDGDVDMAALEAALGPKTAALMLTNPSTGGVFERNIREIADKVHAAGGLLYYDGANLNAILGKVRPGDMGFDVMHLNLHKTFATPHGGGGPGAGPVAFVERLRPFQPTPVVVQEEGQYRWADKRDLPESIGNLSAFMGNAGILLRAYAYALMLGREGMVRVADHATLNANYMARKLAEAGFRLAYPERRASHEFIITLAPELKATGVSAMDFAKRLLDFGYHAPTTYFPLLIPECFLIEPTETESIDEIDGFVEAMKAIREEAFTQPDRVKTAPHTTVVQRLDDVKAARELNLKYVPSE
ncbi:aminomethyl-transferring glycine dehydrogenase subunit GcvPB [Hahella sp. SMD15-11]|uniref:Probable glycine dehydrogenase (decarboxylating) subunit 2 n=1 Tax=Thermohahella caldifontis TaxID=3142973 RepID=A0AB39UW91_9GAMM